uniref:G-protein coupled receptors family 1 profile domain-containing protein n=1 Tax=Plectus sambesii TaxID=2011161 RepID=A0A914VFP1_9BILA
MADDGAPTTNLQQARLYLVDQVLNSTTGPLRLPKFVTPTYDVSDYIEIGFLAAIAMVGCPLNMLALMRMLKSYSHQTTLRNLDMKTAYLLLKIHLSIANLLVLLTFCPAKIGWLVTYRWMSGDAMCKAIHFVWLFAFSASSNMIVCIAIDRLRTVARLTALARDPGHRVLNASSPTFIRTTKIMIGFAYVAALLFAAPQCFIWQLYEFAPSWRQCVTMWKSDRLACLRDAAGRGGIGDECTAAMPLEQAYHIGHLVAVFFLPLLLIVLCYAFVLVRMGQFSFRPESMQVRRKSTPYPIHHSTSSDPDLQLEMDDFDPSPLPDHSHPSTVVPMQSRKQSYQTQQSFTGARRLSQALLSSQASTSMRSSAKQRPARRSSISVGVVPNLQLHTKSRTFRSTALLVSVFIICWLPYNVAMLLHYLDISTSLSGVADDYANVFKGLVLVSVVLNPFIYGFGDP